MFLILVLALCSSFNVQALPESEKTPSKPTECRIVSLVPGGHLGLPEVDIGSDTPIPPLSDPMPLENITVTLNEDILSGTYSLRNGVIRGLSTLSHSVDFNMLLRRIEANATLDSASITGDYEVIDGRANLTALGAHTFSGAGPLDGNISGVVASLGFALKMDPETQFISIQNLQIQFDFKNASIIAENFVLDGEPVDWAEVNAILKPTFDMIWGEAQQVYVQLIQDRVNWLLEGCTLMDLIQLIKPKPPQQ